VKASVPEARLVAGSGDPAQLAGALGGTRREALVTAGDAGAWLFADGYGCFERQAETLPVDPDDPIDPTGGGDILFAHYLAARLLGGAPEAALRRAVAGRAERLLDPDRHRHLDPR
jgi:sugar/nucleoside kinase (ribokinase family)